MTVLKVMPSAQLQASIQRIRRGFTVIEAVMVLLIVAVIIGALTPSVLRQISHARVNRAVQVVAADFMQIQTLAGRQGSPLVMAFDATAKTVTIQQPSGTTLTVRRFGVDTEYKLTTLTSTLTSVLVLPNGMTSGTVTVTVGQSGYTRQARMSRAGQVRVL